MKYCSRFCINKLCRYRGNPTWIHGVFYSSRAFLHVSLRERIAPFFMCMQTREATAKPRHSRLISPPKRRKQSRDPASPDLTSVCELIVRLSPDAASSISNPRVFPTVQSCLSAYRVGATGTRYPRRSGCTLHRERERDLPRPSADKSPPENQLTASCCFGIGHVWS